MGKEDILRGFKENVITGHLIPAGTGSERFQHIQAVKLGEEIPVEITAPEEHTLPTTYEKIDITEVNFGDDDDENIGTGDDIDDDFPEEEYAVDENELTDEFGDPSDDAFLDEFSSGDDDDSY